MVTISTPGKPCTVLSLYERGLPFLNQGLSWLISEKIARKAKNELVGRPLAER